MQEKSALPPFGNPFVKNKFECPEAGPAVQSLPQQADFNLGLHRQDAVVRLDACEFFEQRAR